MPIDTSPQHVRGATYQFQISVPTGTPYWVAMSVIGDGSETDTAEILVPAIQSLVDLLQGWSGKYPGFNVVASGPMVFAVAPTLLEESPPPPPPPPGG